MSTNKDQIHFSSNLENLLFILEEAKVISFHI